MCSIKRRRKNGIDAADEPGEADPKPSALLRSSPTTTMTRRRRAQSPGRAGRAHGEDDSNQILCLRGVPSGLLDSSLRFLLLLRGPNLRERAASTDPHLSGATLGFKEQETD
ncbi:hypothetical protein PIB30_072824 [Stylosanthes scabra]|uniref:Uncharacterized protein n=1 Tax=Stylosanthes scabra TaxID=79078 RepID=A0ABU6USW3_9FABA|nr:hypothetical protein [Stylosanthes scabra]